VKHSPGQNSREQKGTMTQAVYQSHSIGIGGVKKLDCLRLIPQVYV
jgi:hypothetical protein